MHTNVESIKTTIDSTKQLSVEIENLGIEMMNNIEDSFENPVSKEVLRDKMDDLKEKFKKMDDLLTKHNIGYGSAIQNGFRMNYKQLENDIEDMNTEVNNVTDNTFSTISKVKTNLQQKILLENDL